ncbi:MAG: Tex family protein [Bacteroidota bacterium]
MSDYNTIIATELNIKSWQVQKTVELIEGGATVPFISRYRKEMTGSLDEVQITSIRDRLIQLKELDKRKEAIIQSIIEQGKMTDLLHKQIMDALTMSELEDIYLPYRPKRKTRASIAIEKGLEPLAKILMSQNLMDVYEKASKFINEAKGVKDEDEALAGARDIIAEWVNESRVARERIRNLYVRQASISSKIGKGKEEEGKKYENYYEWDENLLKAPSHRVLAMLRGEDEGFLKLTIAPNEDDALDILDRIFLKADNEAADQVAIAIKDSYKRLLSSSMETEVRAIAKEKADKEAIRVFTENLRQLLMASPLGQKNILALDPGFRTGCKVVCLDKQGKLLHNETIYPHPPANEAKQAANKILNLVNAYKIEAIAIGNGTAGRETESFIRKIPFTKDIVAIMVNENGASVYSASPVAREEFPDYDVTVRGAVSIGRRLMDPLAELVKIDPKSIGVGQYQHDVNQNALQKSLEDTVVSCVNTVGVEVNTASKQLLSYVSGVGPVLAKNIIEYREKNGVFKSRAELKKVARFGDKAFEQAAGFIRIRDAKNPLDNSAVHPESYVIINNMAKKLGTTVNELIENKEIRAKIKPEEFITKEFGLPTINDILKELEKPGRDPRTKFDFFEFDKNITTMNDIYVGMTLKGIITNITAFGAFVDLGVHQDGLIHISQMTDRFISDPNEVVKLNQKVEVKVLEVDINRKRIQLTMKK